MANLGVKGGFGKGKVDVLEDEVRGLQLKLATQEEEFRLQQSTLMEELNKVVRITEWSVT